MRAREISTNFHDEAGIASSCIAIASFYDEGNKQSAAFALYEEALVHAENARDWHLIAACRGNIAVLYQAWGNLKAARGLYEEVTAIFEEHHAMVDAGRGYLAIASVLELDAHKRDSSLMMHEKAIAIFEQHKAGIPGLLAESYYDTGRLYHKRDQMELANAYFQKALLINREIGHLHGQIAAYSALVDVCIERKDYPKAHEYIATALALALESAFLYGQADMYIKLGEVFWLEEAYQEALNAAQMADPPVTTLSDNTLLRANCLLYAKVHDKPGNRAKAKDYRNMAENIR